MKKILVIISVLLPLAGVAIGVYAALNPQGTFEIIEQIGPDKFMVYLPIGIILFVGVMMLLGFYPLIKGSLDRAKAKKMLQQRGQRKIAKVLSVQDTGITVNNNPYIQITVETTQGQTATFKMMTSRLQIPRPGDSIQILYDPSNPTIAIAA